MTGLLLSGDWGSTNLRLFLQGEGGRVIRTLQAPLGVRSLKPDQFSAAFTSLAAELLDGSTPAGILLCGMVGARQGWREAAYVAAPAGGDSIALAMTGVETDFGPAWITPGLSLQRPDGTIDVMRGEETQILGATGDGLVVTPGTHSKWARVEGGRITDFTTVMTGELFEVLSTHSMLGLMLADGPADPAAFRQGVERARGGLALMSLLFTARTEGLFGHMEGPSLSSYLSGLLIGSEVAAGLKAFAGAGPVTLIAGPRLTDLYTQAFAVFGVSPAAIDGDRAVARGLWTLWTQSTRDA